MLSGQRTVAAIVLIAAMLCGGAVAAPYRIIGAPGWYIHPYINSYSYWYPCVLPYHCGDPIQFRIELERYRHMQDLREQGRQSDGSVDAASDGPWGRPRYIPPPTPEANIQPAYRGKSQLLPQYELVQPPN